METNLVPVEVKAILPAKTGVAVFIGDDQKVFLIYVDHSVGAAITMFLQGVKKERPLTHDLIQRIFRSLGIGVERVVVNDLRDGTYYARLFLREQNDLGTNLVEIDARPSDCLALAIAERAPIFVARHVVDEAEDMSWYLKQKASETQSEGPEDAAEDASDDEDEANG